MAEPIAIIGMACRVPGAGDPRAFWRLLRDGTDAIREVPADRWDADAFHAADPLAPGKMNTRWGGFLDDVFGFDPGFFGISPREAAWMDPQQRLILEIAWEALEDAGQTRPGIAGSATGVYVGATAADHASLLSHPEVIERLAHPYAGTGMSLNVLAGRVSYAFDLLGPSMTIDTACSSSLVAVHLACQSLGLGETAMALAGGVHLILAPIWNVAVAKISATAPDGRCKAFDAAADGYVRAEGAGLVVLKRLSDARAAGDRVIAVIRGSAVNQDGRSNGLTAPSGAAQLQLLRAALANAGAAPAEVGYVEAHGTGTALGDPIEVTALGEAFGPGRARDRPLAIGSVKTNIGHLEGAAGVAGLIKVALCAAHRELPASLHYRTPNPHIPFHRLPVRVQAERGAWPDGARLAGVSAFGWAGTNAHVLVEPVEPEVEPPRDDRARLLPLSAHSTSALAELAGRYQAWLAGDTPDLDAMCATAGTRRTHHAHRLAIAFRSAGELSAGLAAFAAGEPRPGLASGKARRRPPRIGLVFSGQGGQWPGMGRALLAEEPAFRAAVDAVDDSIRARTGWSVIDELTAPIERSRLGHTEVAQIAIFAIQLGLVALLRSWGLAPAAVAGHSLGEVAAAHTAGALTLAQAVDVVWQRSRLMQRATGLGQMALFELSEAEAAQRIAGREAALSIAALNSSRETVIAGDRAALADVIAASDGARMLPVDYAFHSPQMAPFQAELVAALVGLVPAAPRLPIASTVTGGIAEPGAFDAAYWARNLREPVRFAQAVDALIDAGCSAVIELGPQPALVDAIGRCAAARGATLEVIPSLRRNRDDSAQARAVAGALYAMGHDPDFAALAGGPRRCIALPMYPWQRQALRADEARWRSPGERAEPIAPVPVPVDRIAGWLHGIQWTPVPAARPSGDATGGWLILADADGVAEALAERIARAGGHAVLTQPCEDVAERVREMPGLRGVVHLWSTRAAGDLDEAEALCAASVLQVIQAIAGERAGPRLWLVTRGAQPAGLGDDASVPAPHAGLVWGAGRAIELEHPDRWGGLIDLAPTPAPASDADALLAELTGRTGPDQIAVRGGQRYAARLAPIATEPATPTALRGDRSYLVTGGLGALGLHVARWLVERGARHVALVGRRPPSEAATAAIAELTARGARIVVLQADISREDEVARVLREVERDRPALVGVIHAAGVVDDALVTNQGWPRFAGVLAPKLRGAWHLDRLTRGHALELFVMFSSAAAVLGSMAQASYAAGNAALDALAHHRRARGLPALAVAWSLWADGGMAHALDGAALRRWRGRGLVPMAAADALAALDRAIALGAAHVGVLPIEWAAYGRSAPSGGGPPALLSGLIAPAQSGGEPAGALAAAIDRAAPGNRRSLVAAHVGRRLAAVLGLDASQPLDPQQGLFDMGMDSLMTVELRNRLRADTGIALSANALFNYATIDALAGHLIELLAPAPVIEVVEATEATSDGGDEGAIAIVGMSCRFPGGASDPERYWQLLRDGVDAITEIPASRWPVDEFFDPRPGTDGKMYVRRGGFLDDVAGFDPGVFGISPREARALDPQQRLLLEVSWEALERAGLPPTGLGATPTGVFVGASTDDYAQLSLRSGDPGAIDSYAGTGTALCFAAGRLSYTFGLQGPSLVVETACSSSLVAIHLAIQALRNRECDLALAGGVHLMLRPETTIYLCKLKALAADGRCKTFDADANGYVRGEGCGMIVVRRLADARARGERVLAVLRGSAVNHDGPSSALTVPNGRAQEALIRRALADARVAPGEVGYVEAHGTGTVLGDPIEIEAIDRALAGSRDPAAPLYVGSVKTNLGHLEPAAGIAGLIKVVLAMQHGVIPPHLHLARLNPRLAPSAERIRVPTRATAWPAGRPIAGVSSFGLSGTNAHVIVEPAPPIEPAAEPARPWHLLAWSARDDQALGALSDQLAARITQGDATLAALCATSTAGRSHFESRVALAVDTPARAAEAAAAIARGATVSELRRGRAERGELPRVGFVFGDRQLQPGMARALYEHLPVFRAAFDRCAAIDPSLAGWFEPGAPGPIDARRAEPARLAIGHALAELWRAIGVEPVAVVGRGAGQLAAACATGAITLEAGMALAIELGRRRQADPAIELGAVLRDLAPALPVVTRVDARDAGCAAFVELSPAGEPDALPSLAPSGGDDDLRQLLDSVAALYTRGLTPRWEVLVPAHTRRAPLPTYPFQRTAYWTERAPTIAASVSSAPAPIDTPAGHAIWGELRDAEPAQRSARLRDIVRAQVAGVLGLADPTALPVRQGLFDLGLDSLMATELRDGLARVLGVELPATIAFDHPTVEALAEHLLARFVAPVAATRRTRRNAAHEPIAIVGIGCRFPGAHGPDALWAGLLAGVDATSEMPGDRWDIAAHYDPDPAAAGKTYVRRGGFVAGVDRFDARFFAISPREAAAMDPQQRVLLETAWEALEDAGVAPDRLRGSQTGVFVGTNTSDYLHEYVARRGLGALDTHFATGNTGSVLAGRLAYVLGLHGPALAIDTACSSSLVAVHLAVASLRAGECELVLAGGVNLMLSPVPWIAMSRLRALAPDGRCKTFSADADGYGRAEGCGVVVLRRLSDARARGERVLAVVLGTAVNQDGPSSGLTVPSGPAQRAVIQDALAAAGVAPAEVDYVEAHGTGTALGDPIEVAALAEALGDARPADAPVVVGSIKANLGHMEAAAGIAGLIKTALALHHRAIPPQIHAGELNPRIAWRELPIEIPRAAHAWPVRDHAPTAGLSAFGFSGTNAHAILRAAPDEAPADPPMNLRPAQLLVISARSEAALARQAARFADQLAAAPQAFGDSCYTASTARAHLPHRLAVVADDAAAAIAQLRSSDNLRGVAPAEPRGLCWLFTGQGAQYAGMGRELFATEPVFRATLERCDALLRPHLPASLLDVMFGDDPRLDQTAFTQPAVFAFEVALAELYRSLGVIPTAVFGHSVGEYAAAWVAGAMPLDDGLALIAARGALIQALPPGGAMAAVLAGEDVIRAQLAPYVDDVAIAAVNGPSETVISGRAAAISRLGEALERAGHRVRPLQVSHAFHSPLLDPMLDALEARAAQVAWAPPRIAVFSNVTGEPWPAGRAPDAAYWREHARAPVRFADATAAALAAGHGVFLELGPGPVLSGMGRRCPGGERASWIAAQRNAGTGVAALLRSLGELHVRGVEIDFDALAAGRGHRRCALPSYPFEATRHWFEDAPAAEPAPRAVATTGEADPLLGARLATAMPAFEATWNADTAGALYGLAAPAPTALLAMARAGAARAFGDGAWSARAVTWPTAGPLLAADERRAVQLHLSATADGASFQVFSRRADDTWQLHARGELRRDPEAAPAIDVEAMRARCTTAIDLEAVRQRADERGAHPRALDQLARAWRGHGELIAELDGTDDALDVALAALELCAGDGDAVPRLTELDSAEGHGDPRTARWVCARATEATVTDRTGTVIARLAGARWLDHDAALIGEATAAQLDGWLYDVAWPEVTVGTAPRAKRWLVLGGADLATAMRDQLAGADVMLAAPPTDDASADALAATITGPAPIAIVGLWPLDTTAPGELAPADEAAWLEAAQRASCGPALALIQALTRARVETPIALWLVTRGCQAVAPGDAPQLAPASVWGLGRVLALELPALRGGLVDLAPVPAADEAAALCAAIADPAGEDQLARRGDRWHGARLRPAPASEPTRPLTVRGDASYLIAGGLDRVGLRIAHWLVDAGARHLVLVGGSDADPAVLRSLCARATVRALPGDPADLLAAALADLSAPLAGVVHAAGDTIARITRDATAITPDDLAAVLRPKARTALLLHRLTAPYPLDFFLMFSSVASVWGSAGLAHYAAGNASLDALAHARRAAGLPALSVNWGPWSGAGAVSRQLAQLGLPSLIPALALDAMGRLATAGVAQRVVARVHWPRFKPIYEARGRRALVAELAAVAAPTVDTAVADRRAQLAAADPLEREDRVTELVRAQIAGVLGLAAAQVELTVGLFDLGMDSMTSVELADRLGTALGAALPSTLAFDHPSARAVIEHLLAQLGGAPAPRPARPASDPAHARARAELDQLSEDELLALLSETVEETTR